MIIKKIYKHPEDPKAKPFNLNLKNKITILLGPNGAGKTTIMNSIEKTLKKDKDYIVMLGTTSSDINKSASYNDLFNPQHLINMYSSEGERIMYTCGKFIEKVGATFNKSVSLNKKIIILMDGLDSGLSYDRILEYANFIKDEISKYVYKIIISANSYELATQFLELDSFFWVPTLKYINLGSYEQFINLYKGDNND